MFSKRLMHSIVNDTSRSAAAGVDTRSNHFIFDSASQMPPLRMHSAIEFGGERLTHALLKPKQDPEKEWGKRGRR